MRINIAQVLLHFTSRHEIVKKSRIKNPIRRPELTAKHILAWSDAHHARTGRWPGARSGRITDSLGDTWMAVDMALRKGHRGFTGGSSLPRFLVERRGKRNLTRPP